MKIIKINTKAWHFDVTNTVHCLHKILSLITIMIRVSRWGRNIIVNFIWVILWQQYISWTGFVPMMGIEPASTIWRGKALTIELCKTTFAQNIQINGNINGVCWNIVVSTVLQENVNWNSPTPNLGKNHPGQQRRQHHPLTPTRVNANVSTAPPQTTELMHVFYLFRSNWTDKQRLPDYWTDNRCHGCNGHCHLHTYHSLSCPHRPLRVPPYPIRVQTGTPCLKHGGDFWPKISIQQRSYII